MATDRQLKINLLNEQNRYAKQVAEILRHLSAVDANASPLALPKAVASRSLIKTFWDMLPDEQQAYEYNSIEEQITKAKYLLTEIDFSQKITLHMGWDVLAFSCTLEAAWYSWEHFHHLDIDTFNCCIYPEDLHWYVVRAGSNLYPMTYTDAQYRLMSV